MLKRIFKQKRYFKNIYKAQKGITGLETAIILIAFVVVAAVFAYTVLSAGLFSTQKSQEAVYSGLAETQATMVVKGAVLSEMDAKFADACDSMSTFQQGTNSVTSLETAIVNQNTGSIKTIATTAVAGDTMTLSAAASATVAVGDVITFWAKTDGAINASFGLHDDAAIKDAVDKVALIGSTTNWTQYSLTVTTAGNMFYGVFATTGGCALETYYIDDIMVTPYADRIDLVLALSTGGSPIDFTQPQADTNNNGIVDIPGDSATKTNKMVINYNDASSHVADVWWSAIFIGNNNGDQMLDPGEKIKLTISLKGVTVAKVDANHQFTLEIKSPKGAILSLQRTMPARLYAIDNLN